MVGPLPPPHHAGTHEALSTITAGHKRCTTDFSSVTFSSTLPRCFGAPPPDSSCPVGAQGLREAVGEDLADVESPTGSYQQCHAQVVLVLPSGAGYCRAGPARWPMGLVMPDRQQLASKSRHC
jgi:hypothetical protein